MQLLEFLIKHGSERVVDDARSHLSLIRMLRQFHYIDPNGKDQGINVRNRSQELVKLLGDVDAIRAERKKARANRNKFGGMEGTGGAFSSGGGGGGGRYGGFGSDSYGGYSGGVFGDGGGFGGASDPSDFRDSTRRSSRFEEYDEEDDEPSAAPTSRRSTEPRAQAKPPQPPPKAQEVDLFDFGDDDVVSAPAAVPSSTAAGKKPATGIDILGGTAGGDDDDEFDDFQSASPPAAAPTAVTTTASTQFVAPKPVSAARGADLTGLVGFTSNTTTPTGSTTMSPPPLSTGSAFAAPAAPLQQQQKPSGYQAPTPNYYTSVNAGFNNQPSVLSPTSTLSGRPGMGGSTSSFSSLTSPTSATASSPSLATAGKKPAAAKSAGGDAFGSLWNTASASAGIQKTAAQKGPNLASMAKEKSSAGIWGTTGNTSNNNSGFSTSNRPANGGGDLLG